MGTNFLSSTAGPQFRWFSCSRLVRQQEDSRVAHFCWGALRQWYPRLNLSLFPLLPSFMEFCCECDPHDCVRSQLRLPCGSLAAVVRRVWCAIHHFSFSFWFSRCCWVPVQDSFVCTADILCCGRVGFLNLGYYSAVRDCTSRQTLSPISLFTRGGKIQCPLTNSRGACEVSFDVLDWCLLCRGLEWVLQEVGWFDNDLLSCFMIDRVLRHGGFGSRC